MQVRGMGYRKMIIGVTGCAFEEDQLSFLQAGADCVLTKPVNIPQLNRLLEYMRTEGVVSHYDQNKVLSLDSAPQMKWVKLGKALS